MKIVLTADLHVEHSRKNDNDGGERQSIYVLDALDGIVENEQPDCLVIIGDFFDAFGKLESSIAVEAVERVIAIASSGVRVVFIAGNHDYPDVAPQYFGKSMVQALFGNLSDMGIDVIDKYAEFLRIGEGINILGIPYRETYEQFEQTCLKPIEKALHNQPELTLEKIIPCWHVGIPFGTAWRGDENENAWIDPSHPAIKKIFSFADQNTVYCGHYHGPSKDPCGSLGYFIYVGSPATRSRSESGQDKRVMVWEDGQTRSVSTHLSLDQLVESVDHAQEHINKMIDRFGGEVVHVLRTHVKLPENASLDEYNICRSIAQNLPGDVRVDRPLYRNVGKGEQLITRLQNDPDYGREQMEVDMARLAVSEYFKGVALKSLSADQFEKLSSVDLDDLSKATLDDDHRKQLLASCAIESCAPEVFSILIRYKKAEQMILSLSESVAGGG